MELFELIRKEHFVNGKGIRQIARELRIHRRMVRQAIIDAIPPQRQSIVRTSKKLTPAIKYLIDAWLQADHYAPRKQRHTSGRIHQRLVEEYDYDGSAGHIRKYVARRKRELGLKKQAFIPQTHAPGDEAEVDWYEAYVDFPFGQTKIYLFEMRACHSGKEFHIAFFNQTQQCFLEGHVKAFEYFGGVFKNIRYDNLTSAVKKVLKGRQRIETDRFIALRSHYLFDAIFCLPGQQGAHEKGGVEGGVGRFRRHHLVPVPKMNSLEELNVYLLSCCKKDDERIIQGKSQSVIQNWQSEVSNLGALPLKPFATEEICLSRVNNKSLVRVKGNDYSVPVQMVGQQVEVQLKSETVSFFHSGKEIAHHNRAVGQGHMIAKLEHYLPLLQRKPGALIGSVVLAQARENGDWPSTFDAYWQALQEKYGSDSGTRIFIEILIWIQGQDSAEVVNAMQRAQEAGSISLESLQMLVRYEKKAPEDPIQPLKDLGNLAGYDRPFGEIKHYDILLLSGRIH